MDQYGGLESLDVYGAATSVYNTNPASIVICSIESFRRRLRNPKVCSGLKHSLSRVVIDEVHLSSGTQGAHHSLILSRLKQIIFPRQKDLTFIGASATIADARKHVGALWGCHHSYVEHVDANNNQSAEIPLGIVNHVLYRPKFGTSTIGAVVDITSAVGHQRRPQGFGASRGRVDKLQKMVAFSDSHEIVANWYKNLIQMNPQKIVIQQLKIKGAHIHIGLTGRLDSMMAAKKYASHVKQEYMLKNL